jgi:hypothetical protein
MTVSSQIFFISSLTYHPNIRRHNIPTFVGGIEKITSTSVEIASGVVEMATLKAAVGLWVQRIHFGRFVQSWRKYFQVGIINMFFVVKLPINKPFPFIFLDLYKNVNLSFSFILLYLFLCASNKKFYSKTDFQ